MAWVKALWGIFCMALNMFLLMKTRMEIGCLLVMFPGSKFIFIRFKTPERSICEGCQMVVTAEWHQMIHASDPISWDRFQLLYFLFCGLFSFLILLAFFLQNVHWLMQETKDHEGFWGNWARYVFSLFYSFPILNYVF